MGKIEDIGLAAFGMLICSKCNKQINQHEPLGFTSSAKEYYCMYCTKEDLEADVLNNKILLKRLGALYKKQIKIIAANRLE